MCAFLCTQVEDLLVIEAIARRPKDAQTTFRHCWRHTPKRTLQRCASGFGNSLLPASMPDLLSEFDALVAQRQPLTEERAR